MALGRVFSGAGDAERLARAGTDLLAAFDAAIAATPENGHRRQLSKMREETRALVEEAHGLARR